MISSQLRDTISWVKRKKLNDEKDYKKKKKRKKDLKARIEIVTGLMVNGIEKRLE